MDETAFPFLRLPTELQVEVLVNISLYSDLKHLCLVSKKFSNVAIPRLYYKVDLRTEDDYETEQIIDWEYTDLQILPKVHSLLINPANLCFVRIFKTGLFGLESTTLMNQLLFLFQRDSLLKFSYFTRETKYFPTPEQLQALLGRQKRLQNLELYSHMAPWLKKLLEQSKSSQNTIVKTFTKLDIGSSTEADIKTVNTLLWPLKNLKLSPLQRLSLHGTHIPDNISPSLIDLFAGQSFVNLTKLFLIGINFQSTVTLNNTPSLKLLLINSCRLFQGSSLILKFPDNAQIQSLTLRTRKKTEMFTHHINRYRGLMYLVINIPHLVFNTNQVLIDFIKTSHKNTF